MIPDIFNSIAKQLNFTYSIAMSRDRNWGSLNKENGEWNGIIRDIVDGEADIGVAFLTITKTRSEATDFMIPFYSVLYGFFISKESSYSWTAYFEPFTYNAWIALSLMIIVIALSLALVAKVGNDKYINEFTVEKCFVFVFGAFGSFSIRRWSVSPVNTSSRLVYFYTFNSDL